MNRSSGSHHILLPLLLCSVFAFMGCAGLNHKREVVGNTFVSTYSPVIRIEVSEQLKYSGAYQGNQSNTVDLVSLNENCQDYDFKNRNGTRYFSIRILSLKNRNYSYTTVGFRADMDSLYRGQEILGGKKYEYIIYETTDHKKAAIIKVLVRKVSATTKIKLYYWEIVGDNWENNRPGSKVRQQILEKFLTRSKEAFSVVKDAA